MANIQCPDPRLGSAAARRKPGILLVDDAAVVRSKLGQVLLQNGFFIWVAAGGKQAVELFRDHHDHTDLVLLDLHMPGFDGMQTLAALQELEPDVRCCFLTGDTAAEAGELLRLGAVEVLLKPMEPLDVVRAVNRILMLDDSAPIALAPRL